MRVRVPRSGRSARAAALAVAGSIAFTSASCDADDASTSSAIIGGTPSTNASVVMLVSYPPDQSVLLTCSAAVIAPTVLLTAAHCVDPMTHPDHVFGVFLGADATTDATPAKIASKIVAVSKTTMHPDYDRNPPFTADIAIVELAAPVSVPPLPVATAALPPSIVGAEARIVGYGETHYDDPNYVRREALTTIAAIDPGDTITVGDAQHRSCVGDSGGPALTKMAGVETIVGVDSYADLKGCLEPAHYRRTDAYAAFLAPYLPSSGEGGAGGAASSSSASGAGGGPAAEDGGGCAMARGPLPDARWTVASLIGIAAIVARRAGRVPSRTEGALQARTERSSSSAHGTRSTLGRKLLRSIAWSLAGTFATGCVLVTSFDDPRATGGAGGMRTTTSSSSGSPGVTSSVSSSDASSTDGASVTSTADASSSGITGSGASTGATTTSTSGSSMGAPLGSFCSAPTECQSGYCTNSICCVGDCAPYLCNAMGVCATMCTNQNQNTCADGYYCDLAECFQKKATGVGCNMGYECDSMVCDMGACL